jgi:glucose/arabinose dehydrogenase
MHKRVAIALLFGSSCLLADTLPPENEFGPSPTLVAPDTGGLPTVKVAKAIGWPEGAAPTPAPGLTVDAFAEGLDHPRWLHVLPNGDVLVAESRAPEGASGVGGIKGLIADLMMWFAGATGGSADRITLLRDGDGDGVAETRSVLLQDLRSPIGMALVDDDLYVANADALLRFPFTVGQLRIDAPGEKVVDLPGGSGLNHHWTKSLIANADGTRLYVGVGSNSNIGENGMDAEVDRAAILEVDPAARTYRVYASGLRNPVGMDWSPHDESLWTVVNERDELGNQLVPDYLTAVEDGAFYGWPYSYWGAIPDTRVDAPAGGRPAARAPDYALGAHTASLGLAFYTHAALPQFAGGALVGQHGSWNRSPRSGYKVVYVAFEDGAPVAMPEDVLSGFLSEDGKAYGRPVGVAVDRAGAILVADDVGNTVWRVRQGSAPEPQL